MSIVFKTNIPHHEDISAIGEMLAIHRQPNELHDNSCIIELIKAVLQNN